MPIAQAGPPLAATSSGVLLPSPITTTQAGFPLLQLPQLRKHHFPTIATASIASAACLSCHLLLRQFAKLTVGSTKAKQMSIRQVWFDANLRSSKR